jgi:hypothetical protein
MYLTNRSLLIEPKIDLVYVVGLFVRVNGWGGGGGVEWRGGGAGGGIVQPFILSVPVRGHTPKDAASASSRYFFYFKETVSKRDGFGF